MSTKVLETIKYIFTCDHCQKDIFSLKGFDNDLKILVKILCEPCYQHLMELSFRYIDLCN